MIGQTGRIWILLVLGPYSAITMTILNTAESRGLNWNSFGLNILNGHGTPVLSYHNIPGNS
jgi:hypothetical protein